MNASRFMGMFALITILSISGLSVCLARNPTNNPVKPVDLAEFDQIINRQTFTGVVAVIASWCPPCRKELPILDKLNRRYRDKGITIVALSVDADGAAAVQPLVNETKVDFPVYWIGMKAVAHYKIRGVPTLLLIRQGQLIEKRPGSHSKSSIEKLIRALITPKES